MFKRAQRSESRLRLAICGPAGSGKTYSALLLAMGLGGKIAVIDTERGSANLYAHLGEYDVAVIEPPYSPDKYQRAIHEAERAGYTTVIIDSLTHAWSGDGGLLDQQAVIEKSGKGNSYTAWRSITPMHNALVDTMLGSSCHIIATMRTKTEYELQDKNGKKTPVKVGMAPVQREGMDYEFTLVFDVTVGDHIATSSKDRTSLFDGKFFKISQDTGKELAAWLGGAVAPTKTVNQPVEKAAKKALEDRLRLGVSMCEEMQQAIRAEGVEPPAVSLDSMDLKQLVAHHKQLSQLQQAIAAYSEADRATAKVHGQGEVDRILYALGCGVTPGQLWTTDQLYLASTALDLLSSREGKLPVGEELEQLVQATKDITC